MPHIPYKCSCYKSLFLPSFVCAETQDGYWWLLDRALVLYNLGVSPRMRLGFTHLATLEQGLFSLQQMADRLDRERTSSGRTLLRMSIEELQKTIVESLRQYTWHTTWLLEGWKQEGCLAMAAVTSRLLEQVGKLEGTLLSFVPEVYLEAALDMVRIIVLLKLLDNSGCLLNYGKNCENPETLRNFQLPLLSKGLNKTRLPPITSCRCIVHAELSTRSGQMSQQWTNLV